MIISISRRCDIPRFQFDWFMECFNRGFVDVANPYNPKQIKCVSLVRDDVDIFVFWTRDPEQILANADIFIQKGFPFYVMVSLTGYPSLLEPNQAPAADVIESMKSLSQKIGKEKVIWRYDPIILTSITDNDFHKRNFSALAQNLEGAAQRVIISIYDKYAKAEKRFNELEREGKLKLLDMSIESLSGVLSDIKESAQSAGMEIQSCAENENLSMLGIRGGACIDAALIKNICGAESEEKDKNQRPNCLCCKSIDIGAYKTCKADCVYCYAR